MRFVIVEDEIRIREGIRKLLPKLNDDIVIAGEAENGLEGLALIQKENPDVIITDVRMPVMDGLEMLRKAYDTGCRAKAIVLSAYSEFEYARSAIRLGVTEYLLKPVVLTDFSAAVERVREDLEKERGPKPEQIGGLNQVVKNILTGDLELDDENIQYMEDAFGISPEMPMALLVAYFEEWTEQKSVQFVRKIKMIMAEKPEISYCIQTDVREKEVRLVLYHYMESHHVKRWIQGHFLSKDASMDGVTAGWSEAGSIRCLKARYDEIEYYLEWNILLGDEVIISCPEIRHVQTAVCVYPLEIEKQMKNALCAGDWPKVEKSIQKFHGFFFGQKMYDPKNVKDCYVRFLWAMINFSKETGNMNFENFDHRELLEKISHAKTRQGICKSIDSLVCILKKKDDKIENLNVKRAVAMIHEFYRTGITLEEIADRLGMTPEYLGTQFHQAMGVNFSAYVRKFRVDKAKKMLLGTELKLYQIAELAGYSDPKYFSRVFKAETGQLPADYRRTHK